jgi:predicted nucleic acid-binding Zn ribbon protein
VTVPDEPTPEPATGPADPHKPDGPAHDESGLELAKAVARSLSGIRPAARRKPRTRRIDPRVSGAHPDDRDPQTLDSTLGRLVAEQGWGTDLRMHGALARWGVIVGPEVAQHVSPVSFEQGVDGQPGKLLVAADSTAWATQMRLLASTVVKRLNQELGEGTVGLIDVQGPSGPTWKKGLRSVRGGRGPRDTYG